MKHMGNDEIHLRGTVPLGRWKYSPPPGGLSPPPQRATPRPFPPLATSTAPITATLRPPPVLTARQFPSLFALLLCLFRYPPSSDRRCVQFSLLFIVKLRRVVRSFPSADPASPFARLCDYRLSPIERPATFRRARFMHRIIPRQAHYRLQCKFNRTDKCAFENLQRYPYRLRCAYLPFPRLCLFVS